MAIVELLGVQKAFVGKQKEITLRILVDRSSVEVFGMKGEFVITDVVFPDGKKSDAISLFSDDKEVTIKNLTINKVATVWR